MLGEVIKKLDENMNDERLAAPVLSDKKNDVVDISPKYYSIEDYIVKLNNPVYRQRFPYPYNIGSFC